MKISIHAINQQLRTDPHGFIRQAEADYDARITAVAESICRQSDRCPVILLSGPSGSGKTTTARKLEEKLDDWGYQTHTLSMDDYFIPLTAEEQRLAAAKKLDLESPNRVDVDFLNQQLADIIAGRPTPIPEFCFRNNTRRDSGRVITRRPGELVILEGIHALNPDVITIPETETVRLYVSVRTRMVTEDGKILHPKRIRLLRRILRDKLFRGRPAAETVRMFADVQRGENRYIMPYKPRSHFDIDTFFPYEVCVYKDELLEDLQALRKFPEIRELLEILNQADIVPATMVPPNALIREFIGAEGERR